MGNSASNANGRQIYQRRTQSPSPAPGSTHRSLRTKKKSLELPDLASLSITSSSNSNTKSKSQSIPIPSTSSENRGRPPQVFPSTDLLPQPQPQPQNQPFPPRGTPYYRQQVHADQRRIQELYNKSNSPASPPTKPGFIPEIVHSSIPSVLTPRQEGQDSTADPLLAEPVTVTITWRGGGYNVLLARAGDDEWKGRQVMKRESEDSPVFYAIVDLLPGTHHIRFLVDDQWRVADDLPTAVDDQGSLANYVAIPLSQSKKPYSPPLTIPTPTLIPLPPQPAPKEGPNPANQAQWTNVLPPELLEAFREEELYLSANQGQHDNHNHLRINGFVPAPNIPPAPALPRHLDKLILNMRVSPGPAASAVGNVGAVGVSAANVVQQSQQSGVGSGQGGVGRGGRRDREKTREERREERRRGRGYSDVGPRRNQLPPAPPPSEVGGDDPVAGPSTPTATNEQDHPVEESRGGTAELTRLSQEFVNDAVVAQPQTSPIQQFQTHLILQPQPLIAAPAAAVPSRAITIDTANMPSLTDDASVLPVPSHVVLHHLSTSAIRNGVLAVGNTTRYRKKYLTTIYYKPT